MVHHAIPPVFEAPSHTWGLRVASLPHLGRTEERVQCVLNPQPKTIDTKPSTLN